MTVPEPGVEVEGNRGLEGCVEDMGQDMETKVRVRQ